jgi:hypothetical protein
MTTHYLVQKLTGPVDMYFHILIHGVIIMHKYTSSFLCMIAIGTDGQRFIIGTQNLKYCDMIE